MLNREVIKDLLEEELKERGIRMPQDITKEVLAETFCRHADL